jgi:DNA-binding PadR family transcriptional regulator
MYDRRMTGIARITQPTLDVLEVLLTAHDEDELVHGWAIMKATKRAGPTVYKVLDRLEDGGLISGEWEQLDDGESRPRRRFYRLNGDAVPAVRNLLAERRPQHIEPHRAPGFAQLTRLLPGGSR